MSKLEELIQQYCPDGVEYRPIWSLTAWDKKFNGIDKSKQKKVIKYNYLLAADLKSYQVENGTVKLLTTNISNLYTTEELAEDLASDGEVVAIPWGGNPVVQYYKGRFLTADNRIATSLDTTLLSNKFLYYCMLNQMKLITSFYRGSGIKHPEMAKVLDLEIPVPPLPVQEEIVRILDTFTELQAELQAELQKRLQQYNYYRDNLLSFEGRTDVEWKKLGDVCDIRRGIRVVKKQLNDNGIYPVFQNSIPPMGYYDQYNREGNIPYIICAGSSSGSVGYCSSPFWAADDCFTIEGIQVNSRYAFHSLKKNNHRLFSQVRNGSMPRLPHDAIDNLIIPIPSLEEQERIANILDRFETLTTDITAGLPAEIEARRKQYEHYRDQLLTFKQKA